MPCCRILSARRDVEAKETRREYHREWMRRQRAERNPAGRLRTRPAETVCPSGFGLILTPSVKRGAKLGTE